MPGGVRLNELSSRSDERRRIVWDELRERDLGLFAALLTTQTLEAAAARAGVAVGRGALNLFNLVWLSVSCALRPTMNFVKSLAKQLAPRGVRVNGVAPGPVWTPLQVSGGATQEKLKNFGSTTPLRRPGQPAVADTSGQAVGQPAAAAG